MSPIQLLKHLNSRWCPLGVHAKKKLKQDYYTKWNNKIHLTAFGKHLDNEQMCIKHFGITISNKDKLQFYLEQMYASNSFNKKEMTKWENKPKITKNNFDEAKLYFEGLVKDYETCEQNSGGMIGKSKYKSANQAKEAEQQGNKLREYIARIATATVVYKEQQDELTANLQNSANAKTKEIKAMASQIKNLTKTVALLTKSLANKENKPSNRPNGSNCQTRQFTKPQSMGCYCWSHGFHPAGLNHMSTTCKWQKEGHDTTATWTNRFGGCLLWPLPIRVKVEDQAHATHAGKTAPTS
jgi:hypothetical protein